MESVNLSTISSEIPNRGRPRKIDKSIFCNLNVHLTVKHNRALTKYIGPKNTFDKLSTVYIYIKGLVR